MGPKIIAFIVMAFAIQLPLHAQVTIKSFILSNNMKRLFYNPRISTNPQNHQWVVVWSQSIEGNQATIVGRTVKSTGVTGPLKILVQPECAEDFDFDSFGRYHLLTYAKLLPDFAGSDIYTQPFSADLGKKGPSNLITRSRFNDQELEVASDSSGKFLMLLENRDNKNFTAFLFDTAGKVQTSAENIFTYRQFLVPETDLVFNKKTNTFYAAVAGFAWGAPNGDMRVDGYVLKSDGTTVRKNPSFLQAPLDVASNCCTFTASSAFSKSGDGFVIWGVRDLIKFRKLAPTGALTSPGKILASSIEFEPDFAPHINPQIVYDGARNQFIAVWIELDLEAFKLFIKGAVLNAATGNVIRRFNVAETANAGTWWFFPQASYLDNRILVVWSEILPNFTDRNVRAAIVDLTVSADDQLRRNSR